MEDFFMQLSVILVGSAILAAMAISFKQPILLAYILCGLVVGPSGLGLVTNVHFIEIISHLGITFLLFLAGLNLHPQKLVKVFSRAVIVTAANAFISFITGFLIAAVFKFNLFDSVCIGFAMMFSSTILVVKLLPTTTLHHKKMGAICIGILILQDLMAVGVLAFIRCFTEPDGAIMNFALLNIKLVALIISLVLIEYYVLRRVMAKVELFHEALFILGLAWCFGVASISHQMGLFFETGAFFSGVVLARHNIARFIAEQLKPLREFFLVLFFFTLGAHLNPALIKDVFVVGLILSLFAVLIKPYFLERIFLLTKENRRISKEASFRLGQLSEFGLLIGISALEENLISSRAGQLIQVMVILTFVFSAYYIFKTYPTPIGIPGKNMKT